ncbi:hypothetical protein QBC35DRAFT_551266, partial [Podospora australis]
FFRETFPEHDLETTWLDFHQGKSEPQARLKSFVTQKVQYSQSDRPDIGDSETVTVQTISTVTSALHVWRNIVARADRTIFLKKRSEDPENRGKWKLMWDDREGHGSVRGVNPVGEVSRWIHTALSLVLELSHSQTFEKKALDSSDIVHLLEVLWTRPQDLQFKPRERVAFHSTLLLAGFGFRPGSVMLFPYKRVRIRCLRVPTVDDPERTVICATITVEHNKRRKFTVSSQNEIVSFHITFASCQAICLLSLIISQALHENAFENEYRSLEQLLSQPKLEHTESLTLPWKKEFEDREIFPVPYSSYWNMWNRLWFVAGNRDSIRPYSLRVGAGAFLDGPLTLALRGHLISNSTPVFEASYQPREIRQQLLPVIFSSEAAGTHDDLFQTL